MQETILYRETLEMISFLVTKVMMISLDILEMTKYTVVMERTQFMEIILSMVLNSQYITACLGMTNFLVELAMIL